MQDRVPLRRKWFNSSSDFHLQKLSYTISSIQQRKSPIKILPHFFWGRCRLYGISPLQTRVSDPDLDPDPVPYWIRIQSGQWIRIRIRNPDPDP
jgi:hypothetical protein